MKKNNIPDTSISSLSSCELLTLSNAISLLIAQSFSENDIAVLAAFFTLLGDSLAAIAISCDFRNDA